MCNLYCVGGAKVGNCIGRDYGNMWVEIEAMVIFFIFCYRLKLMRVKKYLTTALRRQSERIQINILNILLQIVFSVSRIIIFNVIAFGDIDRQ